MHIKDAPKRPSKIPQAEAARDGSSRPKVLTQRRRLQIANDLLQETLDPASDAVKTARVQGVATPTPAPLRGAREAPKDFSQLYSDKVTASSVHKAQARGVRYARRQADYARLLLSRALDNFGPGAHETEALALKKALNYEVACRLALTEAHKEHVASVAALNKAQEAYLAAVQKTPPEALAARFAAIVHKTTQRLDVNKHVSWPEDESIESIRWISPRKNPRDL